MGERWLQSFSYRSQRSAPHAGLPGSGAPHGTGAPRVSDCEGQQGFLSGVPEGWGTQTPLWKGTHRLSRAPGPRGRSRNLVGTLARLTRVSQRGRRQCSSPTVRTKTRAVILGGPVVPGGHCAGGRHCGTLPLVSVSGLALLPPNILQLSGWDASGPAADSLTIRRQADWRSSGHNLPTGRPRTQLHPLGQQAIDLHQGFQARDPRTQAPPPPTKEQTPAKRKLQLWQQATQTSGPPVTLHPTMSGTSPDYLQSNTALGHLGSATRLQDPFCLPVGQH